jgi:hypothetical protein
VERPELEAVWQDVCRLGECRMVFWPQPFVLLQVAAFTCASLHAALQNISRPLKYDRNGQQRITMPATCLLDTNGAVTAS